MAPRSDIEKLRRRDSDDCPAAKEYAPSHYVTVMNSLLPLIAAEIFSTVPLRQTFLRQVRTSGIDDLGQQAVQLTSADGGEPLRDLLRRARPGEKIILGSYELFKKTGPFREFGPIFISAEGAEPPVEANVLTSGYFRDELVLRAYDEQHYISQAQRVAIDDASALLSRWLDDPAVHFVDARFPAYGCFACRFVRAGESLQSED